MRVRTFLILLALTGAMAGFYVLGIARSWLGELEDAGTMQAGPVPAEVRAARDTDQAVFSGRGTDKQILFGDLHVHTTFSSDAFRMSLPMIQGDGAHPPCFVKSVYELDPLNAADAAVLAANGLAGAYRLEIEMSQIQRQVFNFKKGLFGLSEYEGTNYPVPTGEWTQWIDREGRKMQSNVLPVKDPFHLPRALIYLMDLLRPG